MTGRAKLYHILLQRTQSLRKRQPTHQVFFKQALATPSAGNVTSTFSGGLKYFVGGSVLGGTLMLLYTSNTPVSTVGAVRFGRAALAVSC